MEATDHCHLKAINREPEHAPPRCYHYARAITGRSQYASITTLSSKYSLVYQFYASPMLGTMSRVRLKNAGQQCLVNVLFQRAFAAVQEKRGRI